MEFHIDMRPSATQKFIANILPGMIAEAGLSRSRYFLQVKVDRDLEDLGSMIPLLGLDTFLIVLKPTRDMYALGITLAHELLHVAQVAKGVLKFTPKGRRWKGKFYHRDYPYLHQPWELQAFARQEILFRRALESNG